jgi:hypothetical protein
LENEKFESFDFTLSEEGESWLRNFVMEVILQGRVDIFAWLCCSSRFSPVLANRGVEISRREIEDWISSCDDLPKKDIVRLHDEERSISVKLIDIADFLHNLNDTTELKEVRIKETEHIRIVQEASTEIFNLFPDFLENHQFSYARVLLLSAQNLN